MTRSVAGLDNARKVTIENRIFYRYGGHIELIRFKECYGIPRGHEHYPLYSHSIKNMNLYCIFLGKKAIYRNIPKISPVAYIFQGPFLRGLFLKGRIYGEKFARSQMYWASLIVGRKFTVFALFYLVFEGNFQLQAPGGLIPGGAI